MYSLKGWYQPLIHRYTLQKGIQHQNISLLYLYTYNNVVWNAIEGDVLAFKVAAHERAILLDYIYIHIHIYTYVYYR